MYVAAAMTSMNMRIKGTVARDVLSIPSCLGCIERTFQILNFDLKLAEKGKDFFKENTQSIFFCYASQIKIMLFC